MGNGHFHDLLDTVDVAGEGRNNDTADGFIKDFLHAMTDRGFGRSIAFDFGIRGIGHEQINALRAQFRKLIDFKIWPNGSQINLEVAGFDDTSFAGVDA